MPDTQGMATSKTDGTSGRGKVIVFESPDGEAKVDVVFDGETVWLTQAQMAGLFERDQSVVARHIGNVFREGELSREGSMQILHRTPNGGRPTTFYDLDVIISVGYRVKSKRGTSSGSGPPASCGTISGRGYALNEKRLAALGIEAEQAIELLASTMEQQRLTSPEGAALLDVIRRYARTWRFLRAYDEDDLPATPAQAGLPTSRLDIATARSAVVAMRDEMIDAAKSQASSVKNVVMCWDRSS